MSGIFKEPLNNAEGIPVKPLLLSAAKGITPPFPVKLVVRFDHLPIAHRQPSNQMRCVYPCASPSTLPNQFSPRTKAHSGNCVRSSRLSPLQSRTATMQKWLQISIRSHFLTIIPGYPAIFLQNRIRIVATCARVALPCGSSVVPVTPVSNPSPYAHSIAEAA